MRNEPPTGEEFERMIARISDNVLLNAGPPMPPSATTTKPRFRLGALSIAGLLVLGVGAAGGALAIGLGNSPWGQADPTATVTATASTSPSPSATTQPTVPATIAPAVPAVPTVAVSDTVFSPPGWGSGVTVTLSGFMPDTVYAVSIDARYAGESEEGSGGYFSQFSSPVAITTDGLGAATLTWTPDTFPHNLTGSGESGYLLGSYIRVDGEGGPQQQEGSGSGFADPIALSPPLSIAFLPIDGVSVTAPSCIEPEQLVAGQSGFPVRMTGLVPGEIVFLQSSQTGGPSSYGFSGNGIADEAGSATMIVSGNTSEYPVSTSAAIAPGEWQLRWSASDRATPTDDRPIGHIPLTVGGCSGG